MLFTVLLFLQSTSAGVLTFEVQEADVWIGNNKNIPDYYGTNVTVADTPGGDYLEGNGFTPKVSITYLPKGGADPGNGDGTPDAGGGNVALANGDERSYYYASPQDYRDGVNIIKKSIPGSNNDALDLIPAELKEKYTRQVKASHAVYSNITTTPTWMENRVYWSLDSSDHYVWFYCEDPIRFIAGTGIDAWMPPAILAAKADVDAESDDGCQSLP